MRPLRVAARIGEATSLARQRAGDLVARRTAWNQSKKNNTDSATAHAYFGVTTGFSPVGPLPLALVYDWLLRTFLAPA
eukprot:6530359-Pyramimonas_sp.AAC.1